MESILIVFIQQRNDRTSLIAHCNLLTSAKVPIQRHAFGLADTNKLLSIAIIEGVPECGCCLWIGFLYAYFLLEQQTMSLMSTKIPESSG